MSRREFSVSYHGQDQDDHTIDVQLLAPALLAFGRLLREANNELNAKKSTTKVLVVSDFEHKCFNINFELVIGLYDKIVSLLGTDTAKNAKDVLEWIGLLKPAGIGGSGLLSYLAYLRWKKGREIETQSLVDQNGMGIVKVTIPGTENTVNINNHIYNLSQNPTALRATRDALTPLGQDGFESMKVGDIDDSGIEISGESAQEIIASCSKGIDEAKEMEPDIDTTSAWLSVYSPVYDLSASKWRFKLGTDIIYADISKTQIAKEALSRGGALVHDSYLVKLEITTMRDAKGHKKEPEYKVLEVTKFVPATPLADQPNLV